MSEDSVILFIIETGVIHLGWGTWTANEELGTCNQRLPSLVIGGGLADEYTVENARESCGSSWIAHKDRIEDRTWVPLYDVEQRRGVYVSLSHFTYLKRHVCKSV